MWLAANKANEANARNTVNWNYRMFVFTEMLCFLFLFLVKLEQQCDKKC